MKPNPRFAVILFFFAAIGCVDANDPSRGPLYVVSGRPVGADWKIEAMRPEWRTFALQQYDTAAMDIFPQGRIRVSKPILIGAAHNIPRNKTYVFISGTLDGDAGGATGYIDNMYFIYVHETTDLYPGFAFVLHSLSNPATELDYRMGMQESVAPYQR